MTQEEFNILKELEIKFSDLCNAYVEKRQTFNNPDYNIENDTNEWNFIDDYDSWMGEESEVHFVVDTSGYKHEGKRYVITVPVSDILNDGN